MCKKCTLQIRAYSLVVRRHIRIVEAAVQFRLGPQNNLELNLFFLFICCLDIIKIMIYIYLLKHYSGLFTGAGIYYYAKSGTTNF